MSILIGTKNDINDKLIIEISEFIPIQFIEYKYFLKPSSQEKCNNPQIIIVNLMDIGSQEEAIRLFARKNYPETKLMAVHCFQDKSMITRTLDKGYDAYFSVFNLTEELPEFLNGFFH